MFEQPSGALAGLRVIDFSRVLGGPYGTQLLADHGAEVIKVEPPQGDETREWGPPFEPPEESGKKRSSYYLAINRNKRGFALDLSKPEGRAVAFKLLEGADVMVENFKPGTLEKWGMGYEDVLKEQFPKLIHCRISGFGEDGPLGNFPGYDAVAQAMAGLISVNGAPESGPVRMGVPIIDLATGLNAVIGILMALFERQRSGQGQFIETTLYDTGISLMHPHGINWLMSGKEPALTGNAHTNVAPYDLFETASGPIFLGIGNTGQFEKACKLLGREDLATDPRYATNALRLENRSALTVDLAAALGSREAEPICLELLKAGVPAGPAHTIGQVLSHDHTKARKMVIDEEECKGIASPIKLSRTPGERKDTPPRFGGDARDILAGLGYDETAAEALIASGIVPVQGKD
jgi:formyl-CoA transferase